MKVPITRPVTGPEELQALAVVVESGWLTQGPRVTEFEEAVAGVVGAKHAVASTSCTTALHLALLLQGIGPGDDVIVPSYTWIATANVVRMVGARPVFADIELETFNVTADTLEAALTPKTRALMPVHQFGLPADLDAIQALATRRKVVVIEDAACALGSRYRGKPIGSFGNLACFSFHPRKLITTGEGGMLTTDDAALATRARVLLNHGASISDMVKHKAGTVEALLSEEFGEVGYNYRMTNLQGALGVVQMGRLGSILAGRLARASRYTERLSGVPEIIVPRIPAGATPNWQSYAVRIREGGSEMRNAVTQRLLDAGIACRPAYMACHVQPAYRLLNPSLRLPNTEQALATVILLPLYPQMTDAEQDHVMDVLTEAVRALARGPRRTARTA